LGLLLTGDLAVLGCAEGGVRSESLRRSAKSGIVGPTVPGPDATGRVRMRDGPLLQTQALPTQGEP